MSFVTVMPVITLFGLIIFAVVHGKSDQYASPKAWILPALLSVVFLLFSLVAVFQEGLLGFWANHSQNLWGNQVWFDLLFAFGMVWAFIVPRAKAVGMNVWPWFVALLCTGGIGLLAMTARLFCLERARNPT